MALSTSYAFTWRRELVNAGWLNTERFLLFPAFLTLLCFWFTVTITNTFFPALPTDYHKFVYSLLTQAPRHLAGHDVRFAMNFLLVSAWTLTDHSFSI